LSKSSPSWAPANRHEPAAGHSIMSGRPSRIRFVAGAGMVRDPAALIRAARRAEEMGYSALAMADHFMLTFAPLIALQAAAGATAVLSLTQTVLDQDFRHPAVLAKELATLDVLSGGRLEVGLGAAGCSRNTSRPDCASTPLRFASNAWKRWRSS